MTPTTIRNFLRKRGVTVALVLAILSAAGVMQFAGVNPAASQTLFLTAYQAANEPADPAAGVWKDTQAVQIPLSAQLGSYAAGGGSISTVNAQALHYKDRLYVRVQWADATTDESTVRAQDFSDAVALEFPSRSASTVPSICMGQADSGVNIWQWRADSQRGLKDPASVYVNAEIDMDTKTSQIFYTARTAGNPYANPELGPVQTLVAHAFGTLATANVQDVAGKGARVGDGWAVVFSRQYAAGDVDQAVFAPGTQTDMAIAVWNGSEGDRNGRKSVSSFVTLRVSSAATNNGGGNSGLVLTLAAVSLVGLSVLGVGLAAHGMRETGSK